MIGFLTILCKKWNTVCLGTGYNPNPKQALSHCNLTAVYQLFTKALFSLEHFYSVHNEFICFFATGLYFVTLTVAVSFRADKSAPDSMGVNSQFPTTNFAWTIKLLRLIYSSCLASSCCGLMHFRFLPLLLLKYY